MILAARGREESRSRSKKLSPLMSPRSFLILGGTNFLGISDSISGMDSEIRLDGTSEISELSSSGMVTLFWGTERCLVFLDLDAFCFYIRTDCDLFDFWLPPTLSQSDLPLSSSAESDERFEPGSTPEVLLLVCFDAPLSKENFLGLVTTDDFESATPTVLSVEAVFAPVFRTMPTRLSLLISYSSSSFCFLAALGFDTSVAFSFSP